MIIGDKDKFAIEFEVDESIRSASFLDESWRFVFGKMRIWIGGKGLGDWEKGVSLRAATVAFSATVKRSNDRFNDRLFGANMNNAFFEVYEAICVDDSSKSDEEIRAAYRKYSPHIVSPVGLDAFDCWTVYAIESKSQCRFIWRDDCSGNDEINEHTVARGIMEGAMEHYINWIQSTYPPNRGT